MVTTQSDINVNQAIWEFSPPRLGKATNGDSTTPAPNSIGLLPSQVKAAAWWVADCEKEAKVKGTYMSHPHLRSGQMSTPEVQMWDSVLLFGA